MAKDTYILGISAFYHDAAAVILKNGEIMAAAQEERFSRKKHDPSFPAKAIEYCLKESGITPEEVDLAAFYDKPFLKFERILETYLAFAPMGIRSFLSALPPWIRKKIFLKDQIIDELGVDKTILFPEHHFSHAASAFFPSPFAESAILTVDGVGEWSTASFGMGRGNKIDILKEIRFPHSLGLLYSAFTYYCGFKVNSGEYKLMGLAPYGRAKYENIILENLIDLKEDGSFKLNMRYFDFCAGLRMTNKRFHGLFGGPPRRPETPIEQKHMDIARSVQKVTEMIMLKMAEYVFRETGMNKLCLAGGVALNCVSNGKILREGPFDEIWVQPASSDAGGALGAALTAWHTYLDKDRNVDGKMDLQKASLLGPLFPDDEIEAFLKENGIPFRKIDNNEIPDVVADLLNDQNVVGWFQGRMEFGPRALGGRSILGDPRSEKMQSLINRKIKFRESFRPFAPSILLEKAEEYFGLKCESPYMLLVSEISREKKEPGIPADDLEGFGKLKVRRSVIPAVTHVDYSARVQTVKEEDNPLYYKLMKSFEEKHGCPVVINTSFNVRGEPIVCTPEDAYRCFMRTNMDFLAMGSYLIDKKDQDSSKIRVEEIDEFELD